MLPRLNSSFIVVKSNQYSHERQALALVNPCEFRFVSHIIPNAEPELKKNYQGWIFSKKDQLDHDY